MMLALSFAHVALAVEVQGPDEAKHGPHPSACADHARPADI